MIYLNRIFFLILFVFFVVGASAQIALKDLANINVDQLSDKQVAEFVQNYKNSGYGLDEMEQVSRQNGMSSAEWNKLKGRINNLENKSENADYNPTDKMDRRADVQVKQARAVISDDKKEVQIPIYGSAIFNRADLTFEPNLRLPTPVDYQLGVDDELIIDVFGYSENTSRVKVSAEGVIRIPNVGQIQVNGLTIDEARKIITSKLSSIYTTIGAGTSVSVTLGNIRSIKVVIIGEVYRPGTYTLPSVSTVFNALNACGGPNRNGSFRQIKLIRNNKNIASVDIYDFLLTGQLKNNMNLQDQDVIKIEPYDKRVELSGEVKNTGFFEATKNEKLSDLIRFAGGFTNNAYRDRLTVFRNTTKEKSVEDISNEKFESFGLADGDHFVVNKLLERFTNRLQITGAVFRPGTYSLEGNLTLKGLIEKADGLREDAFMGRVQIIREKEDKRTEIISLNLGELMKGTIADIPLQKEDVVNIASILEMQEKHTVAIFGEIKKDGAYPFHDKMTLKDLIFLAGGLKDKAELSSVEVHRMVKDPQQLRTGKVLTTQFNFNIDKELKVSSESAEFKLEPLDQIVVRPISGFTDVKKVIVEGEIYYAGSYILQSKNDRISDVIKRAGGLNPYAFPKGAFLIRNKNITIAEERLESEVFLGIKGKDSIINEKKFFSKDGIVGINLDKILKDPGSKYDLLLEDGDVISIPRTLQTVQVTGEVLLPAHVRFDNSFSFKDYISNSGGFASNAIKRKSFVVHANGTASSTSNFLFFKFYPNVTAGSKIYVPQKVERKGGMSIAEGVQIATSTATLAAMIVSLVSVLNK